MRRRHAGFTLVEVLVATAVLALALTVFITGGTQYAGHAHYIQEKTLAQWVARNRMVEYDTNPQWPDTGRDDGTVEMGGREWEWQSEVEETQDPVVRPVDIQVFPVNADTGDVADSPLTTLSGFLTQPAGTAGAEYNHDPVMHRTRGFTLVELLVALAVFGIMAAMAYGGLTSVIDTREGIDRSLARTQDLQTTLFRMQNDLEQTVSRPIRDAYGDPQPAMVGSADTGIVFTRTGWYNPLQVPRSDMQRVGYRIDEDDNLIRVHWSVLDQAQDSTPIEQTMLENVDTIEWRYLDANREWVDRWPPQTAAGSLATGQDPDAPLPIAVELRLDTDHWQDIRFLFQIPGAES